MNTAQVVMSNVVLFQYAEGELLVMLTSDDSPSTQKTTAWRLPSARVIAPQTSLTSLEQTLRHTVGLNDSDVSYREQLYTNELSVNDTSVVCISYMYLSRGTRWYKGSQQVGVFPLSALPVLSETEKSIIEYAKTRLSAKALYSSIIQYLLPQSFDLATFQQVFETVTEQSVDRRNFRKKLAQLAVIQPVSSSAKKRQPTAPEAYHFTRPDTLTIYGRSFPRKTP